jgi:hypothetical protein
MPSEQLMRSFKLYDQYEFAVPLDHAETCLRSFFDIFNHDAHLRDAFRQPITLRFVREESALLSYTRGGPRLFINMDNYELYRGGGLVPPA